MSSTQRGDQNDYGSFNPSSNGPPSLRPPTLSSEQVIAAVRLGFSDKTMTSSHGSNGRGPPQTDSTGFPQIGTFSLEDCMEGGGQNNQNNYNQQQQDQEDGLLPPLRRPHVNEVPADVMAVLLKSSRFEEILAPVPVQNQNQQQQQGQGPQMMERADRGRQEFSQSQQSTQNTGSRPNTNCNNYPQQNYYQSPHSRAQNQASQQSSRSPSYRQADMQQNSPQNMNNGSGGVPPMSSSKAGGQSNIRVQLSASAKEFVPTTSGAALMTTQEESELAQAVAQFQLQSQNNEQDVIDFNKGAYATQKQQQKPPPPAPVEDYSDYILSTVTDAIMDLTNHPANFNRCAKSVTEVLKNYCNDSDTFSVVVTLLCEQCISHPNFCYSGTRLAQMLIKKGIAVNNVTFKRLLLTRCQEEFSGCVAKMKNDPSFMLRARGLLMYFGELFMNIRNEDASAITVLGLGVLEMMQNLVKDPTHENIKAVFQVLKLVGWELDISKDTKIKANFEQLMKDMSYLCLAAENISPQTKQLLDILFEMKNKKWNREDAVQEPVKVPSSPASSTVSSTQNYYEIPDSDDDEEDNDCILLDDESAEVQLLYAEFLKTVK